MRLKTPKAGPSALALLAAVLLVLLLGLSLYLEQSERRDLEQYGEIRCDLLFAAYAESLILGHGEKQTRRRCREYVRCMSRRMRGRARKRYAKRVCRKLRRDR